MLMKTKTSRYTNNGFNTEKTNCHFPGDLIFIFLYHFFVVVLLFINNVVITLVIWFTFIGVTV
jgi:hypothetical protein